LAASLAERPFLLQARILLSLFELGQDWMRRAMHNCTPL
jgi:hypothetical protein